MQSQLSAQKVHWAGRHAVQHHESACTGHAAGSMTEFRRSLVASFLFRFFAEAALMLEGHKDFSFDKASFPDSMRSAAAKAHRLPASGIQYFSKAQDGAVVGAPERHMAADLQVQTAAKHVLL